MKPTAPVLTHRALNRALLERQMLRIRRPDVSIGGAVEHLLGLQAQATTPPYFGLWSRLQEFDPHELGRMLTDREVVRMTLMRGTVHLVTVRDALVLRPLVQQVIERGFNGTFRRRTAGVDQRALSTAILEILAAAATSGETLAPLTGREIGRRLLARGIGEDLEAISTAVRVYAALVQVPPRGVWGAGGQAKYATIESWTGRSLETEPDLDSVVLRYLGAFGPASVMDVQYWSGMTKLKAVLERLRPQLRTFRDEDGTELFDLPDAPRPGADTDAPPRFLGEFDNLLLGHADRRRIVPAGAIPWMDPATGGRHVNNLLIDGMLGGTWWIERDSPRGAATLAIRPASRLTRRQRTETEAEARLMLAFAVADARSGDVRFDA
jgi:hypothetical protein